MTILDKMAKSAYTWNGAISYSTTGFEKLGSCLDYWTKAGTYTGRPQEQVDADMTRIFNDDPSVAMAIVFGLRLITRKPNVENIDEAQTGYGRRDEFYKALVWLSKNNPELLYKNLPLIPIFGCWRDLVSNALVDTLDRQRVYNLVANNLGDHLLRKYLPQIRSQKQARTPRDVKRIQWAKGLCKFLGLNYKDYRKLKSEGEAHIWQKQMTAKQWDAINFNGIPGKAMLLHTSRKGKDKKTVFERHDQIERLKDWVLKQNKIKFTGYPYELTRAASVTKHPSLIQKLIYNKQWEMMLEPMKDHKLGNVLCAIDTSGSMGWKELLPNVRPIDVCLSMGLAFSSLNVGQFKDAVVAFSNHSTLVKLNGEFVDKLHQIEEMETAMGSTNFQSVIDLLVRTRQENPEIPLNEYPETLLVVSDMAMNIAGDNTQTNYEVACKKLKGVGLGEMRIIWWYVNGQGKDFPAQMNDKGVYMIGGFDPVNLKALMGLTKEEFSDKKGERAEKKEQTPLDGMRNFLSQPIFGLISI